MPIVAGDLELRLSTVSGSAGNSTAQGDPNAARGKYMSTTQVSGTPLNNIFDNVSAAENAASTVEYRAVFIYNDHATLTYTAAKVWLNSEVASGCTHQIGLDPVGIVARDTAGVQAATIASVTDAPSGVTFDDAEDEANALTIGNITALHCACIWIKRTPNNTAAVSADGNTLKFKGETAA